MITVEYNTGSNDVGISLDCEGASLLIALLENLLAGDANDHIHLTAGEKEIAGFRQRPESSALSTVKINTRPDTLIVDLLTLAIRK